MTELEDEQLAEYENWEQKILSLEYIEPDISAYNAIRKVGSERWRAI